jgi:hypothetical protein
LDVSFGAPGLRLAGFGRGCGGKTIRRPGIFKQGDTGEVCEGLLAHHSPHRPGAGDEGDGAVGLKRKGALEMRGQSVALF